MMAKMIVMVTAKSSATTATANAADSRASESLPAIGEGVRESVGVGQTVEVGESVEVKNVESGGVGESVEVETVRVRESVEVGIMVEGTVGVRRYVCACMRTCEHVHACAYVNRIHYIVSSLSHTSTMVYGISGLQIRV